MICNAWTASYRDKHTDVLKGGLGLTAKGRGDVWFVQEPCLSQKRLIFRRKWCVLVHLYDFYALIQTRKYIVAKVRRWSFALPPSSKNEDDVSTHSSCVCLPRHFAERSVFVAVDEDGTRGCLRFHAGNVCSRLNEAPATLS